jgi:hypothetical protein
MHFPAGGVGLNVGLQDAMNLGWKLAAEVQGRSAPGLLDTYHIERHPVGEELVGHALAQTALMTAISPEGLELRELMNRLIRSQPEMSLALAQKLSGIDVEYPVAGRHRLVGARVPGPVEFFARLDRGKPLLLATTGTLSETAMQKAKALGISTESGRLAWSGVAAVIARPDGHVWAAVDRSADTEPELLEELAALPATFE